MSDAAPETSSARFDTQLTVLVPNLLRATIRELRIADGPHVSEADVHRGALAVGIDRLRSMTSEERRALYGKIRLGEVL